MSTHVIFDFDGVLCDSLASAISAYNEIRQSTFPALPDIVSQDDMVTVYGGSLRTCMQTWLGPEEHRAFFDRHSAMMANSAALLRPYPGVGALLRERGFAGSSIVSSAYSEAIKTVLSRDPDFDERFVYRIAGRELKRNKTEKIHDILGSKKLGVRDAIYVGDLESDILYCRDVPLRIIAVTYGYHPRWHLQHCSPDYLVDSIEELAELLRTIE